MRWTTETAGDVGRPGEKAEDCQCLAYDDHRIEAGNCRSLMEERGAKLGIVWPWCGWHRMAEVGVIYDQSLGNRGSNFRIRHQANGLHLNWYDVAVNTTRYGIHHPRPCQAECHTPCREKLS